jgi:hypothetical protein
METTKDWIDMGAWVGRHQAFAVIASKCSAAQAQCLRQVRESRVFEQLGMDWDEYCKTYAGISRAYADYLIRQHAEFGDAYFRLSAIARISPETYRDIAGQVDGDTIEVDGQKLALTSENAPRIRAAIQTLRTQLKQARAAAQAPAPGITELQGRLDALLHDISGMARRPLPAGDRAGLCGLVAYAVNKFTRLARSVESEDQ